ncbi:hypothetical protein I545_1047 [Mycobacterium kansasii 662]|uniref:Uncharacterized protein n=2 Tax=Mycobacterium kansasii TaxID=1768 RepID=A0A1V3XVF3_MYCKA|nr:hypothetical protein I547_0199 [Mycobacterium kansasii 824]EUA21161.1 hypothetical protein I545_1047 [Mycobacterium kansasii 662]KEP42928.1 hypothetical protein MKSMC1_19670 [Mycobacterium kansasii]OOK83050.1 hypothetical protein BZL30_0564 [Mycobacterium kansasii]OOK83286.1 hypothetical protein BZL29_1284 [Mycobacterium kansasii]
MNHPTHAGSASGLRMISAAESARPLFRTPSVGLPGPDSG